MKSTIMHTQESLYTVGENNNWIINKKLVKYAWNIERLWKQICLENLEKLEKSLKIR